MSDVKWKSCLVPALYWAPPFLWAVALLLFSGRAFFAGTPPWLFGRDKIVHAAFFGVMAWLVYRALHKGHAWRPLRAAACAFLIAVLYGAADEFAQQFQPARHADLADWAADVAGASLVFVAATARLRLMQDPSAKA